MVETFSHAGTDTKQNPVEARRLQVYQAFCFQYNSIVAMVNALLIEDGLKAEINKRFHDAYLWSKEAFILSDFEKSEEKEENPGLAKSRDGEPGCVVNPTNTANEDAA